MPGSVKSEVLQSEGQEVECENVCLAGSRGGRGVQRYPSDPWSDGVVPKPLALGH